MKARTHKKAEREAVRGRKKRHRLFKWTFNKVLILSIVVIGLLFLGISNYIRQPISGYAEQKARFYSGIMINQTVREHVATGIDVENMLITKKKVDGNISSVQVDTEVVNKVLGAVGEGIATSLKEVELDRQNDFNHFKIPIGATFNSPYFSQVGPKVSLHFFPVGSVKTDIETMLTPYGINNSLLEIHLSVEVRFVVTAPLKQMEISVTSKLPLLVEVIAGEVPRYYYYAGGSYVPNVPNDNGGDTGGGPAEPNLPSE